MSHMAVFHYLGGAQVIKRSLDSVVSPPTVRTLFHPSHEALALPVRDTLNACSPQKGFIMNQQKKKKKRSSALQPPAEELTDCQHCEQSIKDII